MEQNRESKGLLPQRDSLTLLEAARYVAERCGVEDMRAREALQDAFAEFKIHPISRDDNGLLQRPWSGHLGWRAAIIDWNANCATWPSRYVRQSWSNIEVSRSEIDGWLRRSSLKANARPTLEAESGGQGAVTISSSPIRALDAEAPLSTKCRSGGRPKEYDWDAFAREIVRRANTPDGLPDRARLTRDMAQWCIDTWGKQPADSTLRERVSKLYPLEGRQKLVFCNYRRQLWWNFKALPERSRGAAKN